VQPMDDAQIRILQLTQFVCQTCKTQEGSIGGGGGARELDYPVKLEGTASRNRRKNRDTAMKEN
jgi:hypothetical protein